MKNIFIIFLLTLFLFVNSVKAVEISSTDGITAAQKQQLSRIEFDYNQKYSSIDNRIKEYTNKMEAVQKDTTKTPEQISLIMGAYERNLQTLKFQKQMLDKEIDNLYKSVLNEEQLKQYKMQKNN